MRQFWGVFLSLLLCLIAGGAAATENLKHTDNTTIRLYTDGKNEVVARVHLKDGWHIYWSNPGEIGKPTVVSAENSDIQIINQTTPEYHKAYDIMDEYLYTRQVYFNIYLSSLRQARLNFSFTECNDVCKPEKISFDLENLEIATPDEWQKIKEAAATTFPQKIKLVSPNDANHIRFELPQQDTFQFVPAVEKIVDTDSIRIRRNDNLLDIVWQTNQPQKLNQALLLSPTQAYIADIVYTTVPDYSLLYILLLAFIGGIVLNAMPCVFPILSLKIFTLLQHNNPRGRYYRAAAYTAGVLISFLLLTALLVFFKQQGEAIGWGFQLQSPWFVGTMAVIFIFLFLLMIEAVHFPRLIGDYVHKAAAANDFTTGFFAVLIASPCTGPFMGAAVGYAFLQSNSHIFAIFTALALGYALPYALIELFPQALSKIMPKPGAWMRKVKLVLSIPILLTALWLLWVLAAQLQTSAAKNNADVEWQPYNAEKVAELAGQNQNIFIDFTAKWCLTCQFNKKFLLNGEKFQNFVKQNNVHLFRADMTENNDVYDAALATYGRDGIPVYIYYRNGAYRILPVFFSPDDLVQ